LFEISDWWGLNKISLGYCSFISHASTKSTAYEGEMAIEALFAQGHTFWRSCSQMCCKCCFYLPPIFFVLILGFEVAWYIVWWFSLKWEALSRWHSFKIYSHWSSALKTT
jgi:hypothetical protein